MSEQPDDRSLLAAHVAGDAEAFGTLFARHRDRLWAVALRTTGNPEDAADALQEAMISAFRGADRFRGDAAVSTWLHRVVVNASLDRIRRRTVRAAAPLDDRFDPPATPGADDPEEHALAGDLRRQVLAALERLPPEQRAALVLVDMEGWPVQEAATVLDVPPGTVKSRCARGRQRLAELLGTFHDAPAATPGTNRAPPASHPSARATGPHVRPPGGGER